MPPAPKCAVSWAMTICVHNVHWLKAKENMMRKKRTKIWSALWSGVHACRRLIVAFEACPSWNETFMMSHGLPELNHRPGHTQQRKVQLHQEHLICVSFSDALGCRSEMCPNDYDRAAQATPLPPISEPMSRILTQELNNLVDSVDYGMRLAIM